MNVLSRLALGFLVVAGSAHGLAQDRLSLMPRYDRYRDLGPKIKGAVRLASANYRWAEKGKALAVTLGEKIVQIDLNTGREKAIPTMPEIESGPTSVRRPGGSPGRGRQLTTAWTPDESFRAVYQDGNVWIGPKDGDLRKITDSAGAVSRIKYGTASWVYGEELSQNEAMDWSPDGQTLWFYRFDETQVADYFLTLNQRQIQSTLDIEAYPKAGTPNPVVDLWVYDRKAQKAQVLSVRDGRPFDEGLGHYVYGIRWSPDGKELLFHRTNRWQNAMEFCAIDPKTQKVRVLVREDNPKGWVENLPDRTFLDEHPQIDQAPAYRNKMLWMTERTGFQNLSWVDLKSGEFRQLTSFPFEVDRILQFDFPRQEVWVAARSAPNPYLMQIHRIDLKTGKDVRVSDPELSHRAQISPTGDGVVLTSEDIDSPPIIQLVNRDGKVLKRLAESDLTEFRRLGGQTLERVITLANDGKTQIYGYLEKPSDFNPGKKLPLLVSVYGGPLPDGYVERFETPDATVEFGWLLARFEGRVTSGRGRAFKDAAYLKLGQVEIDDQAQGVRALVDRGIVDPKRVGIYGTSYGGYSSIMALLRYPDLFTAASGSSSVTDWRNYDTIYTERYMRTPQENPEGYRLSNAMTYAKDLKGRLMIFWGTADNNVHPSNSLQLIGELQRARKSFEVQVGPDQGHTALNFSRMLEFFFDSWGWAPDR